MTGMTDVVDAGAALSADEETAAKPCILIADDSATIRMSLKRSVQEVFEPVEAADGEEAWTILQSDPRIELVITDLSMPTLDGFGLIQRMRGSDVANLQNMPVIVVTGAEDTEARESAFHAGANDFLTKNSDRVELLARLRAHQKLAQTIRQLEQSRHELREQANTDPLTKLANRRFFTQIANKELSLMRRQRQHFAVLMMDIDHFKTINDTYGHPAGDFVLQNVARTLTKNIREEDMVARIGGEEFVVSSPATNRLASIVLAERLRKAVETMRVEYEGNVIPVTISLGIALRPHDGDDLDELLGVADERLYVAKKQGRNRFCVSDKQPRDDRDIGVEMICPKLDEALAMIRHGNLHRLMPHLPKLLEDLIPLFELANKQSDFKLDLEQVRVLAESLKR